MTGAEPESTPLPVLAERMAIAALGDDPRVTVVAERAVTWLEQRAELVGGDRLAWLAAQVTLTCGAIELSPLGDAARLEELIRPGLPRRLYRAEIAASDASRAAVLGLVVGAGFDVPAAAMACRRSEDDTLTLLAEPLRSIVVGPPTRAPQRRPLAPLPVTPPRQRRWRRPPLGLILSVLLLVGAGVAITWGGGPRPSFAAATNRAADRLDERLGCQVEDGLATGGAASLDLQVGQLQRSARVFVPSTASKDMALPLVVFFGDYGDSPDLAASTTGIEQFAADRGFIVALPASVGDLPQWNVAQATSIPDDVAFASTLIEAVAARTCVDPDRVVVAGHGDGAHMAAVVACQRSDRIAAVVMVNGTFHPDGCRATRALPVLAMVDTDDQFFPPAGGFGPEFEAISVSGTRLTLGSEYEPPSVDAAMQRWAALAGCTGPSITTPLASGGTASSPTECRDSVALITRTNTGGGHRWPATATADIWTFLSTQKRG